MRILGFQKTTLLDYPHKLASTIFLGGCNFRCPFCHNAPLVIPGRGQEPYTEEEVLSYLKKRAGLLDGVCVTGGEPTLQEDLEAFLRQVRALGYPVKLDTNGSRPEALRALLRQGLADYVAMDVKSSPEEYARACGVPVDLEKVNESIDLLLSGCVDYEFRTTVVAGLHTPQIIEQTARRIAGAKRYFLQAFVDSGDLISSGWSALSREEMERCAQAARKYVPTVGLRGV